MAISSYLANLRTKVGHDMVLMPAAGVLPLDNRGRLLLVRQSDTGKWATIGGAVDPDESPWEAAAREAHEEAGVQVRLLGVRAVLGGPEFRVTYPNGDKCAYVSIIFDGEVISGTPTPDDDEVTEVGWFSPEELAVLEFSPANRAILEGCGLLAPSGP